MEKKRIVVTGLGIISSNGIGKDAFMDAIFRGITGIKPISLFDTSSFRVKTAGEVKDFDAVSFLGSKGLRTLDRSTKLVGSAAKLALDDAKVIIDETNTFNTGVVVGNTLGSVYSISEFDKEALLEGPQYVNPALFPNTVINSPASQVSIKFNIKGFNTTIATGFSASLDAIKYAADFIRLGRGRIVLAAGVEELCIQTFLGFYTTGFLAGLGDGKAEISSPFDRRRNGIVLGEGSSVLVMEDLDSALERGCCIYAEVIGCGSGFDGYRTNKYCPSGDGLKGSMRMAVDDAGLAYSDIDYICASANSTIDADRIESAGIKEVFRGKRIPVSSVKSMIGECFSASGAFQASAAIGAITKQMVFPTVNYLEKDPECDLDYVVTKAQECPVNNVLINAFGPSGCNTSIVLSKFRG